MNTQYTLVQSLWALCKKSACNNNANALRPPNLGAWKRGSLLLAGFFLLAPGLAPPLLLVHELNVVERPKTFASHLERGLFNQLGLSIEICQRFSKYFGAKITSEQLHVPLTLNAEDHINSRIIKINVLHSLRKTVSLINNFLLRLSKTCIHTLWTTVTQITNNTI